MLRIGNVQLASNLFLAPIAGYCDLAFRLVCRSQGGLGLACTDLLSPQGLLRGTATSLDLAQTNDVDRPVGMQLYGGDPETMAQGAAWAAEHGATIIDVNMGCPVDKVTKKDGGSKLLCIPETAEAIVRAVVKEVGDRVPVTCKMRLGWHDCQPVAEWLAPRLVDAGVSAVTIHGRTTEQKFSGEVSLDGIARVVEAVGGRVPVIGNGDVREPQDAAEMIRGTGCDGVMIGRGALSTPWLFRDAWALQTSGVVPPAPSVEDRILLVRRYFDLMLEFRDERYAMYQIRRRITWFAKRLPPCKPLKEAIRTAAGPGEVWSVLEAFASGELRSRPGYGDDAENQADAADTNPSRTLSAA
ncbi:MAG: tRNA dihydrouridine synthase DusB [Phycisphaerales bacterium]|nr:tRNA dihydrouridine synthase DusB [Phycisphaerales bacterium]